MMIAWIEGATRCLGQSQGYTGLPIKDDVEVDKTTGQTVPVMQSAWQPTPEEMAKIAAGATIYFTLFGKVHPPCRMEVGPVPE